MSQNNSGGDDANDPRHADNRLRETSEPLALDATDFDSSLGTLIWHRFSAILDVEKSAGQTGALLVVDLDQASRSLVASTETDRADVLPLLADALKQAVRRADLLTHIEDYRFAVLLRGAPQDVAEAVAERILQSVANTVFWIGKGIALLSVDVGGAFYPEHDADNLMQFATVNLVAAGTRSSHQFID